MAKVNVGRKLAVGMMDFADGALKGSGGFKTNKALNQLPKSIKNSQNLKPISTKGSKTLSNQLKKNTPKITQSGAARAGNFFGSGIRETYNNTKKGQSFGTAVKNGHMTNGKVNYGKIAGTTATLGVAGRIASGGGVYRDRYGNVNAPGIPFI